MTENRVDTSRVNTKKGISKKNSGVVDVLGNVDKKRNVPKDTSGVVGNTHDAKERDKILEETRTDVDETNFDVLIENITRVLEKNMDPKKEFLRRGYKILMADDQKLMYHIREKESVPYEKNNFQTLQNAMQLQATFVHLLIGDYYHIQEETIEKLKWKHLFIWSLLSQIHDIAVQIWDKLGKRYQVRAALFAVGLLKAMSEKTGKEPEKNKLSDLSKEWNDRAIEQMRVVYRKNEGRSWVKLNRKSNAWGKISLLQLAVDSKNKIFLEQQFCDNVLKKQLQDKPLLSRIHEHCRQINLRWEFGQLPDANTFTKGWQLIMNEGDNLTEEICYNYNIPNQSNAGDFKVKDTMKLQRTIVHLLIGHFYVPKDSDNKPPGPCDFFTWSLFAPRQNTKDVAVELTCQDDLSIQMWRKLEKKDKIPAALFAAALLKAMSRHSVGEEKILSKLILKFSEKASACIQEKYQNNEKKARKELKKKMENWSGTSILKLAVHTKNYEFLEHPICKAVLEEEWYGRLSPIMSVKWLLLCVVSSLAFGLGPNIFATYRQPLKDDESKQKWRDELGYLRRIYYLFQAPITRFLIHGITYLFFLGYFSYVLLIQFSSEVTNDDIILLTFVSVIFAEEFLQIIGKWIKDNMINRMLRRSNRSKIVPDKAPPSIPKDDTSSSKGSLNHCWPTFMRLKWYIMGKVVRKGHVAQTRFIGWVQSARGIWFVINFVSTLLFMIGYILKLTNHLEAARIVLGFDLILLYFRSLQIFLVHPQLGPKILTIGYMFKDLFYFVLILMIFVVSYGMAAFSIMYPNSELSIQFALNLLKRAYWNLYGELLIEELEQKEPACTFDGNLYRTNSLPRCPTASSTIWVPIMMGFYILVSNILLLNLLIGMFTSSYENVQKNCDRLWNCQRYFLIKQYKRRSWTPFFFIYYVIRIILYCREEKKQGIYDGSMEKKKSEKKTEN